MTDTTNIGSVPCFNEVPMGKFDMDDPTTKYMMNRIRKIRNRVGYVDPEVARIEKKCQDHNRRVIIRNGARVGLLDEGEDNGVHDLLESDAFKAESKRLAEEADVSFEELLARPPSNRPKPQPEHRRQYTEHEMISMLTGGGRPDVVEVKAEVAEDEVPEIEGDLDGPIFGNPEDFGMDMTDDLNDEAAVAFDVEDDSVIELNRYRKVTEKALEDQDRSLDFLDEDDEPEVDPTAELADEDADAFYDYLTRSPLHVVVDRVRDCTGQEKVIEELIRRASETCEPEWDDVQSYMRQADRLSASRAFLLGALIQTSSNAEIKEKLKWIEIAASSYEVMPAIEDLWLGDVSQVIDIHTSPAQAFLLGLMVFELRHVNHRGVWEGAFEPETYDLDKAVD